MTAARTTAFAVLFLSALLFTAGAMAERHNASDPALPEDARLAVRAAEALRADPVLSLQPIAAEAVDGLVILRGAAESPAVREAALRTVRGVPGVREIRDEIHVPSPAHPTLEMF